MKNYIICIITALLGDIARKGFRLYKAIDVTVWSVCLSVCHVRALCSNDTLLLFAYDSPMSLPDFFLPARRYASAGNSDRNVSVCPSVRPSVTRRYCVKTKKVSGMISSPTGSPKTLVF